MAFFQAECKPKRQWLRLMTDLAVGAPSDLARLIENDRARTGRSLVEREDRRHSVLKRRIGSTSRR